MSGQSYAYAGGYILETVGNNPANVDVTGEGIRIINGSRALQLTSVTLVESAGTTVGTGSTIDIVRYAGNDTPTDMAFITIPAMVAEEVHQVLQQPEWNGGAALPVDALVIPPGNKCDILIDTASGTGDVWIIPEFHQFPVGGANASNANETVPISSKVKSFGAFAAS